MSLTLLGQPVDMPLGVSPVAFQKMAHPDGEIGTARGKCLLSSSTFENECSMTVAGGVTCFVMHDFKTDF